MNSLLGSTAELAVIIKLKDEITGPLGNIDRSLSGLNNRSATVSSGMTKIGAGLALGAERVAVGLVAVGGSIAVMADKATNAAASYQTAMELVHTQAGATQAEVDSMSAKLLQLAPEVGTNATELAAGLYHIESAGLRGAQALDVLRTAAEGAKVGQADLEDVTNALVGAVNTGISGTQNLSLAMGTLNGIVGSGNMRMADLTGAIATGILPTAKSMGLTLKDVGAALADMTDQGVPAVDAATRLRMTFSLMAAPTSKARDEFAKIGMSSTQMAEDMRKPNGLLVALTDLKTHLSGLSSVEQTQAVSAMFGGGRTSSTILTLLGSLDRLDAKYKAITASTNDFGNAWDSTALTIDQRKEAMAAGFDALKIQLGDQLLPVEGKVLDALTKLVSSPAVTQGIQDFGTALAGLFTDENIASAEKFLSDIVPQIKDFATSVLPPLEEGLKITGQAAKTAFDMFMALPEPVKAAVIAALAANKLTGGLVASGLGDLAKVAAGAATGTGVGGGLLGVQKVFVVNMAEGGMGGMATGGAATAGASTLGVAVRTIVPIALAAGSIYELSQAWGDVQKSTTAAQQSTDTQIGTWADQKTTTSENTKAINDEVKVYRDSTGNLINSLLVATTANQQFDEAFTAAADKLAAAPDATAQGIQSVKDAIDVINNMQSQREDPANLAALDKLHADLLVLQGKPQVTPARADADLLGKPAEALAYSADQLNSAAESTRDHGVQLYEATGEMEQAARAARLTPPTVNVTVSTSVSVRDMTTAQIQQTLHRTAVPV